MTEIDNPKNNRRRFLKEMLRDGCMIAIGGASVFLAGRTHAESTVWQIDPDRCTGCGRCATDCVLTPSAVKCVHAYELCGYCRLCFGLLRDKRTGDVAAAENNRCPVDAIRRRPVEDPYYEIYIDESLCIGCGRCVLGCTDFGNGSLYLQVRHDHCVNCNQCSIAENCPPKAISRIPASSPYHRKTTRR